MATVLFSYQDHTDPRSGGAVHGFHVVEQLKRLGHELITTERKTDARLTSFPRTLGAIPQVLRRCDCIYMRCDPRAWDEAMLAYNFSGPRKPLILEVNSPPNEDPPPSSPWSHPVLKRVRFAWRGVHYRNIARMADSVLCVSNQMADIVRQGWPAAPERVFAAFNGGTPVERISEPRNDGTFRVLWIGGAKWPWQSLDTVVEAAQILRTQSPHVEIHLLTDANPSQFPGDNLRAHGLVGRDELLEVMAGMDAGLCLRAGFGGVYGSPLKLFEMMAAGLPMVGTAVGQIAEVIEDGCSGILVRERDARDVADAITRLANLPVAKLQIMKQAARDRIAEHFTWNHTGDAIGHAIAGALARTHAMAPVR